MIQNNKIGVCFKCGQVRVVRNHHYKGYGTDETRPYCMSCDFKAHNKARREGKCLLKRKEAQKLSTNSYNRRLRKHILFGHDTLASNVQLYEQISYNLNTGVPSYQIRFGAIHGKKLYVVKESDLL